MVQKLYITWQSQVNHIENNNAKPFLSVFSEHIADMTQWSCTIKHSQPHAKNYIQKLTGRRLWMCVTNATICQTECQEKASTVEWCICSIRKCSPFLFLLPPLFNKSESLLKISRVLGQEILCRFAKKTWNGCGVRAFGAFRHALGTLAGFSINR